MKPESLVIAGQHTAVNVFLSLVHTGESSHESGGHAEVAVVTAMELSAEDELRDWD